MVEHLTHIGLNPAAGTFFLECVWQIYIYIIINVFCTKTTLQCVMILQEFKTLAGSSSSLNLIIGVVAVPRQQ